MEIRAIRGSAATESQAAQKNSETSSVQHSGKPVGGEHGKPPAGGGGGAAPTGGAAQSTSSSESSSSNNKIYDKKDANKDGTVSYAEELQYTLKHPDESEETYPRDAEQTMYNQQGKMRSYSNGTGSQINRLV